MSFLSKIKKMYYCKIKRLTPMEYCSMQYRKLGIEIGDNCYFYSQLPKTRDRYLLKIGNNVTISSGVSLLLHDAAIGTISEYKYTDILGKITISDNCFIGCGAIILPGVYLAMNTIVAAGSVVTKSVLKSGCVIGGNPAKFICTVDEYVSKNQKYFENLNIDGEKQIKKMLSKNSDKLISKKDIDYNI